MTRDGLINGYPLPLHLAHHMDDPRSPHFFLHRLGMQSPYAPSTAHHLGFTTSEAYAEWIANDARHILLEPIRLQLKRDRLQRDRTVLGRLRRKVFTLSGGFPL
jgi:hypothetical protein